MITLSGNVCVRNGFELDYCWQLAVASLLPVCDEVVVCDGESTDGTQDAIREWMHREPKIKLCVYPWPNPKNDNDFWVNWLNYCREHLKGDFHLQLDADEVLSPGSYPFLLDFKKHTNPGQRTSLWCHRWNFWRDAQSLIPHGVCCSHSVCRVAPTGVWLPSDGPHPKGAEAIGMAIHSPVQIFHYGFLRERQAFFRKARALQSYFFGSYDPRLETAEARPGNWMTEVPLVEWIDKLLPYTGKHPKIAHAWLLERGYKL